MSGSSGKISAKAKGVNGSLLIDETTKKIVKEVKALIEREKAEIAHFC